MYFLYSLIYHIALIFLLPVEYLKRPREIRKRWLKERGAMPPKGSMTPEKSASVLLHAVSVGEVIAAVPFIKALKERHPEIKISVTTVTDTGQKVARERLSGLADVLYAPFDIPFVIRRVINRLRPSVFITMETELWPNMFRCMKEKGIPVIVLNGRISERSFRRYKKILFFIRKVLSDLSLFAVQDEQYGKRAIELGADKEKVKITGSFKFDAKVKNEVPGWASGLSGPVIVAGSTHRGEEELMLSVYKSLLEGFGDLNLIIAPRHPERFDEVEALIRAEDLPYVRRSAMNSGASPLAGRGGPRPLVLLDSIGELSSVYGIADVVIIGGSFIEHGGQNPLEAAYWGKPVVCGPHMENFPYVEEFFASGAALRVGREGLYERLRELLSSPEKSQVMGKAAKELLEKNSGAVEKALGLVEGYLIGTV